MKNIGRTIVELSNADKDDAYNHAELLFIDMKDQGLSFADMERQITTMEGAVEFGNLGQWVLAMVENVRSLYEDYFHEGGE